jgi:hypothetical protein
MMSLKDLAKRFEEEKKANPPTGAFKEFADAVKKAVDSKEPFDLEEVAMQAPTLRTYLAHDEEVKADRAARVLAGERLKMGELVVIPRKGNV